MPWLSIRTFHHTLDGAVHLAVSTTLGFSSSSSQYCAGRRLTLHFRTLFKKKKKNMNFIWLHIYKIYNNGYSTEL